MCTRTVPGYAAVSRLTQRVGIPPGDITADELDAVMGCTSPTNTQGELRHARTEPRLPDVEERTAGPLARELKTLGMAVLNIGPDRQHHRRPGDFCDLTERACRPGRRWPFTSALNRSTTSSTSANSDLNISGCINACVPCRSHRHPRRR